MSRPSDWSAVGWDRDPVPGDSGVVAATARQYRTTADAVGNSINNLDRIDGANMKGEAITAVLDRIKTVRGQLNSVEGRVAGAATALELYHPVLATTQADSLAALNEAEGHKGEEQRAVNDANAAAEKYNSVNDPNMKGDHKRDYDRALQAAENARASLAAARSKIQNAVTQRDQAADRATAYLQDIDAQSPVKDSWWDKFTDACGKAADWIEKNLKPLLEKLQGILDIASIVCTVVAVILTLTGVGAPVAAFLFAASKVMTIASMAIDIFGTGVVGFMKAVSGRQTWGEFLGSAALLGATIAASKFLGSKLTKKATTVLGRVANSRKESAVKAFAKRVVAKDQAAVRVVKESADMIADKAVDIVKSGSEWVYKNVIQPVTPPSQIPYRHLRRELCGLPAGGGGGGGNW